MGHGYARRAQQLRKEPSVALVERPNTNIIGTKWVFRNKQDENGMVTRNNARLVAQGFTQVEAWTLKKHMHWWQGLKQSECF